MRSLAVIPTSVLSLLLAWCLIPLANANPYFIITSPSTGSQWANGSPNVLTWVKGVDDGVDAFDLEMSRLSQDGLFLIANQVPTTLSSLNILLQDVPPADDYYLVALNSTHGLHYATSNQFSIVAAGSSNATSTSPDSSVPTVTVSGTPDPTKVFGTTFPPSANGVSMPGWKAVEGSMTQIMCVAMVMLASLLGGAFTVL